MNHFNIHFSKSLGHLKSYPVCEKVEKQNYSWKLKNYEIEKDIRCEIPRDLLKSYLAMKE